MACQREPYFTYEATSTCKLHTCSLGIPEMDVVTKGKERTAKARARAEAKAEAESQNKSKKASIPTTSAASVKRDTDSAIEWVSSYQDEDLAAPVMFQLPFELRSMIWAYVVREQKPLYHIDAYTPPTYRRGTPKALLINKATYLDVLPVIHRWECFKISLNSDVFRALTHRYLQESESTPTCRITCTAWPAAGYEVGQLFRNLHAFRNIDFEFELNPDSDLYNSMLGTLHIENVSAKPWFTWLATTLNDVLDDFRPLSHQSYERPRKNVTGTVKFDWVDRAEMWRGYLSTLTPQQRLQLAWIDFDKCGRWTPKVREWKYEYTAAIGMFDFTSIEMWERFEWTWLMKFLLFGPSRVQVLLPLMHHGLSAFLERYRRRLLWASELFYGMHRIKWEFFLEESELKSEDKLEVVVRDEADAGEMPTGELKSKEPTARELRARRRSLRH